MLNLIIETTDQLLHFNEVAQALSIVKEAHLIYPDNPYLEFQESLIQFRLGEYNSALSLCEKAINKKQEAAFYNHLGIVQRFMCNPTESELAFKKSLSIQETKVAYNNLCNLLVDEKRWNEAQELFNKCSNAYPIDSETDALGHNDAWIYYKDHIRYYRQHEQFLKIFGEQNIWNGEDMQGGTLLVHCEVGCGDTIMCLRYLPDLIKKYNCKIEIITQEPLVRLIKGMGYKVHSKDSLDSNINFDKFVFTMMLPRYLEHDGSSYISIEQEVPLREGIKIGVCFQGQPLHSNDRFRSCSSEYFKRFLKHGTLYSIQKEEVSVPWIEKLKINDFTDTAAIINSLDYVIGVDSAPTHLAAAMGKPTYLVISKYSDWRWVKESWYKTMKVFQQPELDNWEHVFSEVDLSLSGS